MSERRPIHTAPGHEGFRALVYGLYHHAPQAPEADEPRRP